MSRPTPKAADVPADVRPLPAPPTPPAPPGLRAVRDTDADALIALIGAAYAEYPGCVLDLPGIDADLRTPASVASSSGAAWWVLPSDQSVDTTRDQSVDTTRDQSVDTTRDQSVDATVGCGPVDDGLAELKRLYVARGARRRGLASALVRTVEAHARQRGATHIELWSDTRFDGAHQLYTHLGYVRTGEDRRLHDPSDTTEWRFVRDLTGTDR